MKQQQQVEITPSSPLGTLTSVEAHKKFQSSLSIDPILNVSSTISGDSDKEFKLSSRRWLVLMACSIFGLAIALTDNISPILLLFLDLLDLNIQQYLYLQPLFHYVMMASAFPIALFVDKYGIKIALRTSAGLFVLHGFLRAYLFYPDLPFQSSLRLPCYIISIMVGAEMMTIFFLLPLKVSETWFSSSRRTVAWAFMMSQINVGVCFGSYFYPRIVTKVNDFKILAHINIVCVIITAISSVILVQKSEPKYPPNERAVKASNEPPRSFRKSIIEMIKHRDIVLHLLHVATFESLTQCIGSVLQPVLKSIGYDEIFIGNLMFVNSFITIVMQIFLAFFVHSMRDPTLICKAGSFLHGLLFTVFILIIISPQSSWMLVGVSTILTVCRSWALPNFTNMTAHLACGIVSQATIIGFSMSLAVFILTVINLVFTKLIGESGKGSQHDYNYSLVFLCILTLVNELIYLGFFQGRAATKIRTHEETKPKDKRLAEDLMYS